MRSVDQHVFLVLDLRLNEGHLEGTLSRPRHYSDIAGEGTTVTDPEVVTLPILNTSVTGGTLHLSTPDPSGNGKPDESTFVLWDNSTAGLAYGNHTFMPRWVLKRALNNETPMVSIPWPEKKERSFTPGVDGVQRQLRAMVTEDQAADLPPFTRFAEVCTKNFPIIYDLFRRYGWLKVSEFGKQTASDFWLLSAHQIEAHPQFANEELAAMKQAVDENQASAANYALFYDSVAQALGKPQHWGTKTVCQDGERHLYRVDDLAGLDRRRDEAYLPPESSYLSDLGACSR